MGSGKTPQVGKLAEWIFEKSEGRKKLRLYSADDGGVDSVKPHITAGLIDHVDLRGLNPWCLEWAAEGKLPDPKKPDGAWVFDVERAVATGGYAYEGFSSFATAMMQSLAKRAAKGENHGGEANVRVVGNAPNAGETGADGIIVGGSNKAHYNIVQMRLKDLATRSMRLPGIVMWTALDCRGTDAEGLQTVLGPLLVGRAMAEIVPSWFHHTFHLVVVPGENGKPNEHRMYTGAHRDQTAPGAVALAASRQPLDTPEGKRVPLVITPANLTVALAAIAEVEHAATAALLQRLKKG